MKASRVVRGDTYPYDDNTPSPPVSRRCRAAAAGLNLSFDAARMMHDQAGAASAPSPSAYSDYSSSSSLSSSSPATPLYGPDSPPATLEAEKEQEDCWNLIPYHVPWGEDYYEYHAGTLPGPEGVCVFLRSPTPLKNRRTVRACTKCRERKAKCSGDKPACVRCISRGLSCHYEPEAPKRTGGPALTRQRQRDRSVSSHKSSLYSSYSPSNISMGLQYPDDSAPHSQAAALKHEEADLVPFLGSLVYPFADSGDAESWGSQSSDASLQWSQSSSHSTTSYSASSYFPDDASAPGHSPADPCELVAGPETGSTELRSPHPNIPSVHAPKPIRCPSLVSFLSPTDEEVPIAHQSSYNHLQEYSGDVVEPSQIVSADAYQYADSYPYGIQPIYVGIDYISYEYAPMSDVHISYASTQEMGQNHFAPFAQDVGVAPASTYMTYVA